MNTISILFFEWKHFVKSKFKVIAFLLFICSCLYSLNSGYQLWTKQNKQVDHLQNETQKNNQKVLDYFDKNLKGSKDRPWIDVTNPFWAIYYAEKNVIKKPSALLPFAIGQTEHYGFHKKITTSSTSYDSDLVEEIANPERLGIGNLDFSFTLLYLMPMLLIILLFNIGGLENDFQFTKLIKIQYGNTTGWLVKRFLFYYIFILISIYAVILIFAFLTEALALLAFYKFVLLITIYITLWFLGFLLINKSMQSSQTNAVKMISSWLLFCVLIPAFIYQYASYKFPINYMTSFLDANRDEAYKMYELPKDGLKQQLLRKIPKLKNTVVGKNPTIDEEAIMIGMITLISEKNNKAIKEIEKGLEQKNVFIQNTYWFNPITFFQNKMDESSNSDYYAFLKFRNKIDSEINKKQKLLLFDSWKKIIVNKQRYQYYLKN